VSCKSAGDKLLATKNGADGGQQFASGLRLDDIGKCAQAESFLHHSGRRLLAQERYFGVGGELAYLPSGFESIELWKTDVEHNQIRLQFFSFLNRFQTIWHFADHLYSWQFLKYRRDKTPKRFEIVCHESTD
jgi:hypothetical protein